MLDTKQLLPRIIGGCFCMFCTIALVSWFAYSVLRTSAPALQNQLDGTASNAHPVKRLLPSVHPMPAHSKALQHIHHRIAMKARGRHVAEAKPARRLLAANAIVGYDLDLSSSSRVLDQELFVRSLQR